jgi:hypothetical protein
LRWHADPEILEDPVPVVVGVEQLVFGGLGFDALPQRCEDGLFCVGETGDHGRGHVSSFRLVVFWLLWYTRPGGVYGFAA